MLQVAKILAFDLTGVARWDLAQELRHRFLILPFCASLAQRQRGKY